MEKFLLDCGDYDLFQVGENEFLIRYHENVQGSNRNFTILNKDSNDLKRLIKEANETEDPDEKFNTIDYLERNFY